MNSDLAERKMRINKKAKDHDEEIQGPDPDCSAHDEVLDIDRTCLPSFMQKKISDQKATQRKEQINA